MLPTLRSLPALPIMPIGLAIEVTGAIMTEPPPTTNQDRLDRRDMTGIARFLHRVGRLKATPRTGWLDRGISQAETESVADHSFRVALVAWLAASVAPETAGAPALDADRILRLALIHDLAEALTGDLPPYDPAAIPAANDEIARRCFLDQRHVRSAARTTAKRAAEDAAMADLFSTLPAAVATSLHALWDELRAGTSPEARFVKQADKLETYLQSREYLARHPAAPMASFAAEIAEELHDRRLAALRDAIDELDLTEPERP